jgi:hypothetical protein
MFTDRAMRLFLIHLAAFVVGILVCAAIDFWLTPGTVWVQWVLVGWGAAIATHAFALFLRKTRRKERIFIDVKARRFAVHLFAYLATVLILLLVNLTLTPQVWWFYWIALGWGAGILLHGWCTFFKRRGKFPAQARASKPAAKTTPRKPRRKGAKT